MEYYSLSDLLKKSAKQICYFAKKKRPFPVTEGMIAGNEAALAKSTSEFKEMRGTLIRDDLTVYYCFDELIPEDDYITLIEHKNITEGTIIESWYLAYSLLQLAVYTAFAIVNPDKSYVTASFFVQSGNPYNEIEIDDHLNPVLEIGDQSYSIHVRKPHCLVDFYLEKARHCSNYDDAEYWDAQWKRKEFKHLKKYFTFTKIKN